VAIIGKDFSPEKLGKDRIRSPKVLILAMVLVAILMVGATAGLIGQVGNSKEPLPSETPLRTSAGVVYTSHSPISILGNGDFTTANGVSGGTGTASDPYIMEGWDILASTATGIRVSGTNMHFVIRNCYVHDGGSNWNGIYLDVCQNADLKGNTCIGNWDGIVFAASRGNTLTDNICSRNSFGIYVLSSSKLTLTNNTCSNNGDGMYLYSSSNNTLAKNHCSSNTYEGINLFSSSNNTLSDNNCSSITDGDGIWLDSSSNNTLSNNKCSNNAQYGLYLYSSSNNTLVNNICTLTSNDGIALFSSSNNNTVIWNQICNNIGFGVSIYSGSNNRVWNNTFIGNNGAGSTYSSGHIQAYDDGTNNRWNTSGTPHGYGNYWNDWTTPDANQDGIVDQPYAIDGSAGAKDYYPQTTVPVPIPEFGTMPFVVMVFLAAIVLTIGTRRRKA